MFEKHMRFTMRLPKSCEFDQMLAVTASNDSLCHWYAIYTLCQDRVFKFSKAFIARGFHDPYARDEVSEFFRNSRLGFRPFLEPIEQDPFEEYPEGTRLSFGLLQLDVHPLPVPCNPVAPTGCYQGDLVKAYDHHIDIGDAPSPYTPITWLKIGKGYIADRALLCSTSIIHLKEEGLLTGRSVVLTNPFA